LKQRVGLELELLAPEDSGRRALAERLARLINGRLQFGLKYSSPGRAPDGRPICELSCAYRVLDARRRVIATLVDDPTISTSPDHAAHRPAWSGLADDVRLALLAERLCWASDDSPQAVFAPLARAFAGAVDRGVERGSWGTVVDAVGHSLVKGHQARGERACEVVFAPVALAAVARTVEPWLTAARRLGFTIPEEAALHAHFDAAPFQKTERLRQLILRWGSQRDAWLRTLKPNPNCTQLGPAPPDVVRVAREADAALPFSTFSAALLMAGLKKSCDLNLLGVVEKRPRQPTLEVRCLPMSLSGREVAASVSLAAKVVFPTP
jgi:Putative amidoligase enzyme